MCRGRRRRHREVPHESLARRAATPQSPRVRTTSDADGGDIVSSFSTHGDGRIPVHSPRRPVARRQYYPPTLRPGRIEQLGRQLRRAPSSLASWATDPGLARFSGQSSRCRFRVRSRRGRAGIDRSPGGGRGYRIVVIGTVVRCRGVEAPSSPRPAGDRCSDRVVDRLVAASPSAVISVVAPAGYGKTTLLAQWAERKAPRAGWVSVDDRDNDAVVLLTYIAVALDRVEAIDPRVFRALASSGAGIEVPRRLVAAMASMRLPFALAIDNFEVVTNPESLDAIAALALGLPMGSQLAIGSRDVLPMPAACLRAAGRHRRGWDRRSGDGSAGGAPVARGGGRRACRWGARRDRPQDRRLARRPVPRGAGSEIG